MKRILLVILIVSLAGAANGIDVRLQARAEIAGSVVTLADVGTLSNGSTRTITMMKNVSVGEIGESGNAVFTLQDVRRALFAAGCNLAEIEISGASKTEVRRVGAAVTPGRAVSASAPDSLCDAIRRYVAAQKGVDLEAISVEVVGEVKQDVFRKTEFRLVARGPLADDGETVFEVRSAREDGSFEPFRVTARIRRGATVVIAERTLVAGAVVGEGDVRIRTLDASVVPAGALKSREEALGMKVSRRIEAGSAILESDIARTLMVRRGDECTVVVQGKGFHIVTKAIARDEGALGDEVTMEKRTTRQRVDGGDERVRQYTTREKFTAVVTGHRRVEIRSGGVN